MISITFTSGTSIIVTATYLNGTQPADLDAAPTVTLYDSDEITVLGTPGTAVHADTGSYTYETTLPGNTGAHDYYIEFAGKSNGYPIVGRTVIKADFATN